MVAPEFLANAEVRNWLNGVEPAWTMLTSDSFHALQHEPSATNAAIRLRPDLSGSELAASAVTETTRLFLRRIAEAEGLKLTATGNLARSSVTEMFDVVKWPEFDKVEFLRSHKVVNEPDFWPLHFVRLLTLVTKLTRSRHGRLVLTALGRDVMAEGRIGALNAVLFHMAFWHLNLSYFDRFPAGSWPQSHIGVVLWALSAAANDWMRPETLSRLCTVPVDQVLDSPWDLGSVGLELRVLRPLVWFGLIESRVDETSAGGLIKKHSYRKTPMYDNFIRFDLRIERAATKH